MDKINVFMTSLLGTSWRTTVWTFFLAVGNLVMNGVSWKTALASAGVQILGILVKDSAAHSTPAEVQRSGAQAEKALMKSLEK